MGGPERLGHALIGTLPQPVSAELVRTELVERLQQRFNTTATTVVAGAGFGKTTTVAQAVRANAVAPLGIDAWVSCRPGHENAEELAAAIVAVLDERAQPGHPLTAVVEAIVALSPIDVCLVIDDCHLLPVGSSAEALLADLVRRLPANGHLLLSGRCLPAVPLARLEAAGDHVAIRDVDLTFSDDEVVAVADLVHRDPVVAERAAGWPALVRLALVAREGTDREFLREELLAGLSPAFVRTLAALVVLGPSTDALIRAVVDDPAPLAELADVLPMIGTTADGVFSAHQLWDAVALAALKSDERIALRRRAWGVLLDSGDLGRAAALAIDDGDWAALGTVAVELLAGSLIGLPSDTVRAWLGAVPAGVEVPSLTLLAAHARFMADAADASVVADVDAVLASAHESGAERLEVVAVAVAAVMAHGRNDLARLVPLAQRASAYADAADDPVLTLLACALPAIAADLAGDPDGVLSAFAPVPWHRLPPGMGPTAGHLRLQALWLTGRADESVSIADTMYSATNDAHLRGVPWLARWFAGDPTGADPWEALHEVPTLSARNLFVSSCLRSVIHACRGDVAAIDQLWADVPVAALGLDDARDSAHLTYAAAACDVARGDDGAAAEHYRRHLARFPVDVALGERHLRRWPALGYVLDESLRAWWDAAALGPSHEMSRACGRALLAARAGRVVESPAPAAIHTQLPLAWSAELALRWHALGSRRGLELATWLIDALGPPAREQLAALDADRTLLRLVPAPPETKLDLRVLGSLQLRRDGALVDDPALRRKRVRQLLMLLVLERSVRRDRVLDVLWPGLGREAASTNLRVTLSHLRRLLEPERAAGDVGSHLRVDATSLTLHDSDHLAVDLWELERLLVEIDRPDCPSAQRQRALSDAVSLWRGTAFDDLADVEAMRSAVEHLHHRRAADLLSLGELRIAAGQPAAALACAERILAADPYREQAHRLAIAALHQLDDAGGIRAALRRLDRALAELGVEAEATTDVLRRQARRRCGEAPRRTVAGRR